MALNLKFQGLSQCVWAETMSYGLRSQISGPEKNTSAKTMSKLWSFIKMVGQALSHAMHRVLKIIIYDFIIASAPFLFLPCPDKVSLPTMQSMSINVSTHLPV